MEWIFVAAAEDWVPSVAMIGSRQPLSLGLARVLFDHTLGDYSRIEGRGEGTDRASSRSAECRVAAS